MKYISPKYQRKEAMTLDVITASWEANNCTVNDDAESVFANEAGTRVTQISGFLNSLLR